MVKKPFVLFMNFGVSHLKSLAKTLVREKCQVRKKSTPRVTSVWYINLTKIEF